MGSGPSPWSRRGLDSCALDRGRHEPEGGCCWRCFSSLALAALAASSPFSPLGLVPWVTVLENRRESGSSAWCSSPLGLVLWVTLVVPGHELWCVEHRHEEVLSLIDFVYVWICELLETVSAGARV